MAYKYKLKEIEVGDTKVAGGVKSVVTGKDPDTGAISWSIDYVPNLSKLVEDSMELANTAKGVYQKAKDDKKFLDIYEQAKQLRNVIRTHVRNNYPSDYKKAIREEEVDEASMSGAAGAYNTPYAFKKKKKSKYKMKTPSGVVSSLGYTMDEGAIGDGADLGPGPKAGPEGVTDSAYTKQFKYKLVPKNKNGTYVQKGAGTIVKNFINMYKRNIKENEDKASKFHEERIEAFDKLEARFDDIKKSIKLAKIETIKYYRDNPESFSVVIGTDMLNDYFNDIETLLQ